MIGFFRRVRKKLADENKFIQYSRYAVGEILLVMVGILLALQVNNWNQTRKNNTYISIILKEIYYDLSDDYKIIYKGVEPRLERKQQGLSKIKEFIINGEFPTETAFMHYYGFMKQGFSITQRTGAFESLKLGGLDKIENDSLRTQLLEFYESDLPRSVNFITQDNDVIKERLYQLEADLFTYEFLTLDDGTFVQVMHPSSYDILNQQSMHKIYEMIRDDIRSKKYRLRSLKRNYKYTMRMIERELEKREIPFRYLDTLSIKRDF